MTDGQARAGFDLDLAYGEERETAFVEALRDCYVECKADQKARVTGNAAVEYMQKGRPSGIAVTTAQWWALEIEDDQWIVIRTSVLKALARRAREQGRSRLVGDGNQYRCALIPTEWLLARWRAA